MTQHSSTYTPRAVRPSHLRGPEPSWRSLFVRSGRPDTITVTTGIKGLCAHTHGSQAALPFGLKRRCECECARRMATPARCAWSSRYVRAYTSSWPTPLPEPGGQSRRRSGTGLFTHGHMQGVPGGLWLSLGIMATWHHAGGSAGFGHDTNLMRRTQPGGRGGAHVTRISLVPYPSDLASKARPLASATDTSDTRSAVTVRERDVVHARIRTDG